MEATLIQIGISLLVAITTAFLTVWLSLRRFYREKWWEAKMRAYAELIQALHNMKRDLEISMQGLIQGRDMDTDFYQEWNAKHRAAWDEIRRAVDVGEFLFSRESIGILETLIVDSASIPRDDYYLSMEEMHAAVEKCLPAIKASARADLQLPPIRSQPPNFPI